MAKRKSLIRIKPKKYKIGDIVRVDFICLHPMSTGLGKDKETGRIIPAHFINDVEFFYNGELITKMNIWESVSTNPYLSINMKITAPGEIKVVFKDNMREVNEKSKKIKPRKA